MQISNHYNYSFLWKLLFSDENINIAGPNDQAGCATGHLQTGYGLLKQLASSLLKTTSLTCNKFVHRSPGMRTVLPVVC